MFSPVPDDPDIGLRRRATAAGLAAEARHAEPLLDVDAVATRLDVSSKTVRRLIDRGELACAPHRPAAPGERGGSPQLHGQATADSAKGAT